MNLLVLHHDYSGGIAFDHSHHRNHGRLVSVTLGTGGFAGAVRFAGGPSRIDVAASASLQRLRALRLRVRFMHTPSQPGVRRHNLIEAHLSFALFVHPDGSLQGTILDATSNWRGPRSPGGIVRANEWHVAEFTHDGISHARLYLDGALVATDLGIPGPVRPVGGYALAVGHWPDPDDRYTLDGYVDDVKVWGLDPREDVRRLLDECCVDRTGVDALVRKIRTAGWDSQRLGAAVKDLLDLGTEIAAAARGADPQRTAEAQQVAADAVLALSQGDLARLTSAFQRTSGLLSSGLTQPQRDAFAQRALTQLQQMPFTLAEAAQYSRLICLDRLLPSDAVRPPEPPEDDRVVDEEPRGDDDLDRPDGAMPTGWASGGTADLEEAEPEKPHEEPRAPEEQR